MALGRSIRLVNAARYVTPKMGTQTKYGVNVYKQIAAAGTQAGVLCAQLGAQVMRISAPWSTMQTTNGGAISYTILDAYLNACAANSVQPIVVIDTSPSWANGGLSANGVPTYLGPNWASWVSASTTFITAVAQHAYAICPNVIVQLWNEPNTNSGNNGFWRENDSNPLPTFAAWNAWHAAVYTGVKTANTNITVIAAGMKSVRHWFVEGTDGTHGLGWIQSFMAGGGVADGIAIHPYPAYAGQDPFVDYGVNANSFTDISLVRAAMIGGGNDANGKAYATYPVHVTEFGNYSESTTGSPQKAIWTAASYRYVDQFHSIDAVGANAAPVATLCYFNLVNNFNGTVETDSVGMFGGNPYAGPNAIQSAGTAFATFMKTLSPVTSVSLFYNNAAATPMLLFTGNTYTMVAKDQSGTVLNGVGTWSTTDATNAPINASTGVISPSAGIGGGTITYTHTASGKTASVVFSVLKTPGAIEAQGGISGLANTAALMAQISSSLGVDSAYNSGLPVPTGSGSALYRDGLGVNHFSIDTTTTSRQFMGNGVMVQAIPTTTPVSDGALLYDPAGGITFTRAWGLQVFRFDPGFVLTGLGSGGASFKIGNWFPFAGGGRVGIELDNTPSTQIVNDCIKLSGASTVGGAQGTLGNISTEFTGGGFWCSLVMYEVRGGNIMSSRVWWWQIGSTPTLLGGVTEGPMTGGASPSFVPPSPTEYQPTGVNFNLAPPVSQLNVSFPLWMLVNGDTQGDPFGVLADTSSPTLTGISGGTVARGATAASIVLTGTNFTLNCQPKFSSAFVLPQSITINSSTQMTVVVAVNSGATPGSFTVLVNNQSSQVNSATQPITIT